MWPSLVFTFLESEEFIHQQVSGSWSLLLVSFQRLHTFFPASAASGHVQMTVLLFTEKVGANTRVVPFLDIHRLLTLPLNLWAYYFRVHFILNTAF